MVEGMTVEAAIRAWEQARKTEEDARKAVFEARAALALANRALDEAGTLEDEARSAAISMMASGDDGPVGWIVDGRVYYPLESLGEIRSIRIANAASESPMPTHPAEEPDGDWKRCDMTCPGCKEAGHVFSRIWESPRDGYKDMRYECRNCGDAWPVGRAAP